MNGKEISTQAFIRGTLPSHKCMSSNIIRQTISARPDLESVSAGVFSISSTAHSEIIIIKH